MSMPANVTDSDSRRSRLPLHVAQTVPAINDAARRFIIALCECANVCSTCRRAPVNVPM